MRANWLRVMRRLFGRGLAAVRLRIRAGNRMLRPTVGGSSCCVGSSRKPFVEQMRGEATEIAHVGGDLVDTGSGSWALGTTPSNTKRARARMPH